MIDTQTPPQYPYNGQNPYGQPIVPDAVKKPFWTTAKIVIASVLAAVVLAICAIGSIALVSTAAVSASTVALPAGSAALTGTAPNGYAYSELPPDMDALVAPMRSDPSVSSVSGHQVTAPDGSVLVLVTMKLNSASSIVTTLNQQTAIDDVIDGLGASATGVHKTVVAGQPAVTATVDGVHVSVVYQSANGTASMVVAADAATAEAFVNAYYA